MTLAVIDPYQEDIKRKILAARAAGWSEQEINQFATQALVQRQQDQQYQSIATTTPKKANHNFLLENVLPILGGIGGATGGFFVGGPVGAVAGGALGSGGARALANAIEGNDLGEDVGVNAAFGALGGTGKLFQAARAAWLARAAGEAGLALKGAPAATEALAAATRATPEVTTAARTVADLGSQSGASKAFWTAVNSGDRASAQSAINAVGDRQLKKAFQGVLNERLPGTSTTAIPTNQLPKGFTMEADGTVRNAAGKPLTIGEIQQANQAKYLTDFENARNAGDAATMNRIASEHPMDARLKLPGVSSTSSTARDDLLTKFRQQAAASAATPTAAATTAPARVASNNFFKTIANKMYTQAFTVPRRQAISLNPEQTAQELLGYGIKGSLENIDNASRSVLRNLGSLVDKSVNGIGGQIKVGNVGKVVDDALQGVKVSGPERQALLERVRSIGTNGSLPGYASPSQILENIRDLESRGFARIQAGTTGLVKNPDVADLGNAYVQVAKELEDNLYSAVEHTGSLKAMQTPQAQATLNQLAKGLGDKFINAKNMGEVRSLMSPFVRAKNMISLTRNEALAAGTSGLGGLGARGVGAGAGLMVGGVPGAVAGFLAAPLLRGVEESARAPIATNAAALLAKFSGRAAPVVDQSIAPTFRSLFKSNIAPQIAANTVGNLAVSASGNGQPAMPPAASFDPFNQMTPSAGATGDPYGGQSVSIGGQTVPIASFTPDVINQMIAEDIQKTGGKNIPTIAQIVNIQQSLSPSGSSASPFGKPTAQQYALASAGVQSLQQLEALLSSDPGLVAKSGIPGQQSPVGGLVRNLAGTGQYEAVANNVIDTLLRLRTGAQANQEEIQMYRNQLFPQAGDNATTVAQKIQSLYQAFAPFLTMGDQSQAQFDPFSNMSSQQSFSPFSQLSYS